MTLIEKIKQMCDSWNIEDKPYVNGLHRTDIEEMLEQMHEWTKEQFIKWAAEWINDNYFEYLQPISYYEQLQNSIDINAFVNDFKNDAEEEL